MQRRTDPICLQMVVNDVCKLLLISLHELVHAVHLFHRTGLWPELPSGFWIQPVVHGQLQYLQDIDESGYRAKIRFSRHLCLYAALYRIVARLPNIVASVGQYTWDIDIVIEECRLSKAFLGQLQRSSKCLLINFFVVAEGDRRLGRLCAVRSFQEQVGETVACILLSF